MQEAFKDFLIKNQLILPHQVTLLAVSGGIDSVVMAHLFQEIDANFEILHCNFHLRGEESDEDEHFVKDLARAMNVRIHTKSFDTTSYAKAHKESIQTAARQLRYHWFEEMTTKSNNRRVATAHHQGDVVETMIYNLTKGTGLRGLRGIQSQSAIIIRPLLFTNRAEIHEYALAHQIQWREDASNASTKYARNLIRHKVLPALSELNPRLEKTLSKSAGQFAEIERFVKGQIERIKENVCTQENNHLFLDRKKILSMPTPHFVLFELLRDFGYNSEQTEAIINVPIDQSGALFYAGDYVLYVDRSQFIISPKMEDSIECYIQDTELVCHIGERCFTLLMKSFNTDQNIGSAKNEAWLDYDKLTFPLRVRTWQQGDYFYPLGMSGKKMLSDFMIDSKIALNLKRTILVLESREDIVWIIGHRIDDRYKITETTQRACIITETNR
jgi:tRNA(Ile)-lysidine synthase